MKGLSKDAIESLKSDKLLGDQDLIIDEKEEIDAINSKYGTNYKLGDELSEEHEKYGVANNIVGHLQNVYNKGKQEYINEKNKNQTPDQSKRVENYISDLYESNTSPENIISEMNSLRPGPGGFKILKFSDGYKMFPLNSAGAPNNKAVGIPIDINDKEALTKIINGQLLSKTQLLKTLK